jgi:hypothetical protein
MPHKFLRKTRLDPTVAKLIAALKSQLKGSCMQQLRIQGIFYEQLQ